jgi:hypothetical protein
VEYLEHWPTESVDRVLEFLPVFENPSFVPCEWPPTLKTTVDGRDVTHMPYPVYSQTVDDFWQTFFDSGGMIHPYNPLPEDPTQHPIEFIVCAQYFTKEYFETATVNQIRRYFALCRRAERFCDGYIAAQIDEGYFVAALTRLKRLREEM